MGYWDLVLCSPAYIRWTIKITLRRGILLSAVFGKVGFAIAVAIVRGSMFDGGVEFTAADVDVQMHITRITFWFNVEFTVCKLKRCTREA